MGFLHQTFSDTYARRDNWLTRIDVRIKLLYIASLLLINLLAKNRGIPLFFLFVSLFLLLSIRIPVVLILRRMVIPILFATLLLLIKGLHEGNDEWISFSVVGYNFVLKEEGLRNGLHIFSKVLGGISLVILLSFTMTISQLCAGLKWFHIPDTITELLAFIYRYIFLLLDEVSTIRVAQKSRLGHTSWQKTIRSYGMLGGMLLIRAFERAERIHEAMRVRGYEGGNILTMHLPSWGRREYCLITGLVFIIPLFVYTGNIRIW
ncbi:MAG: cobalt ECF transporter T component CbiQ [Candidatus Loosdrechtia sp.]|uniref:energy-coupling factor transporter transmembrane component T family protein n=1 Tax=Candidatus Loosdrechtia sp. TaxID=3101272 RepID=UPI003A63907F|nr:MAG: cobalt ECF transporter T component CbiQ [Candidatus Jettenia sp. AMX2]